MSTGEKLLSIIDDIALISKQLFLPNESSNKPEFHGDLMNTILKHELLSMQLKMTDFSKLRKGEIIENAILATKHQKLCGGEQVLLTELLVLKDNELKETLKLASEQAELDQKMDLLRAEVDKLDQDIQNLQRQLKEAEQILATAIYQAKQKLQSINRAKKRPVNSEDLIKFAHRISACNAVCAPLSWMPGDPRRPYPTDMDMRIGILGRMSDMPLNGHLLQQSNSLGDMHRAGSLADPPTAQQNQFAWHPSGEIHMAVGQGGTVPMETRNHTKDNEDIEVMSTDSSSSSSSDSQ